MQNQQKIDSSWKDFLISIESFIESRNKINDSKSIINKALETLSNLPNINLVAIFKLNSTTFEFEFSDSFPNELKEQSIDLYDKVLEKGYVGSAIETGKIFLNIAQEDLRKFNNELIIPLSDQSGIVGLILLAHNKHISQYEQVTLRLISMFGIIISSFLENIRIMKDLEQQTSVLEQRIAARTLDLNQSRKELETIFNAVYAGIIVADDSTGKIIKVNPKACELLKIDNDNLINNDINNYLEDINLEDIGNNHFESNILNDESKQIPILRTIKKISFGNQKYRVESFIDITKEKEAEIALKKSNELLDLKVQERTEDLKILINKLKDEITEREQAEKEVRKMLAKEKELSELKSRFVSMISHEFRTPLTVIKSSSQMLNKFNEELAENDRNNYLKKIAKTVDYMTELIDNVIFIGKTNVKRNIVNKSKLNIVDFCKNIIDDFKITQKKERVVNLKISTKFDEILIDDKLLKLIVTNLLTNASKYSSEDKSIEFTLITDSNFLEIRIKDYGIGIPEKEQNKIFDIFYRAENVGNISGTGLGMAVITESLQILKGEIKFKSEVGKGTEFTVKIPVRNEKENSHN